jgi:flagellar FliL protein
MADADAKDVKDAKLEEQEEGAQQEKKKALPALLPGVLKWVGVVIGAIILMFTVAIVAVRVFGNNNAGQPAVPISQAYSGKQEVLDWYQSLGVVRTRTSDAVPSTVSVDVVLGYQSQDKLASSEITARQVEIKDFLRRFFTEKVRDELGPKNEEKLRIEIRNAINDDILTNSKIRDVKFLTLDIFDQ